MPDLPLPVLLSQALVAFTIEFDNEFEHRMPHRTSAHGASGPVAGPWLVSLAMWANCLRFVGDEGLTAGELRRLARTGTNIAGMRRWRYIAIDQAGRAHSGVGRLSDSAVIRPTAMGRRARDIWNQLPAVIEDRWLTRFGADAVSSLRQQLCAVAGQLDPRLPDCLPILGVGLWSKDRLQPEVTADSAAAGWPASGQLWAQLSRVLLAFALEFEQDSPVSLAVSANLLRVLEEDVVRVRDLPQLTGVSKEAIAMGLGLLEKGGFAVVEASPDTSTWKVARLTAKGRGAASAYHGDIADIEQRWQSSFGRQALAGLRHALVPLVQGEEGRPSPLLAGLEPYPDGWRARVGQPGTLPHFPMVLHRGGFPDGS
jgi:hypothetical protein